jgi:glycosyltransferase involved in cell wall biosynthesis
VGARLLDEGRCVAADIEDWHSEDLLADARRYRPLGLIRRTEEKLLQGCIYTTTTSHALADGLHARYRGRRPEVITNSFPLQPNPRTTPPNDPPVFFWFSQTVGPGRGLEPFLDAWCRMNQRTRVVLLGEANDYREQLLARLPAERRSFVQFFPFVPPSALPTTIADQDVGLALEPSSPANKDLTISNKILQYLNAGLAVVATGTLGQREVLARAPKAGLVVDATHADAFAAMLDGFVADRQFLRERQAAARRLAEDVYCWEREAPRLLALVDTALRADASN